MIKQAVFWLNAFSVSRSDIKQTVFWLNAFPALQRRIEDSSTYRPRPDCNLNSVHTFKLTKSTPTRRDDQTGADEGGDVDHHDGYDVGDDENDTNATDDANDGVANLLLPTFLLLLAPGPQTNHDD